MNSFERIMTRLVPDWAAEFDRKSRDYRSSEEFGGLEPHNVLGIRGQYADIWRKVWKLKKSLWDGEVLEGEQPDEIIRDLISHLFLTLDLMEQQKAPVAVRQLSASSRVTNCGSGCSPRSHLFNGQCRYRLAGRP